MLRSFLFLLISLFALECAAQPAPYRIPDPPPDTPYSGACGWLGSLAGAFGGMTDLQEFRYTYRPGGEYCNYTTNPTQPGMYSLSEEELENIGVYRPGETPWSGTWNIPGFPEVETLEDYLNSACAQEHVQDRFLLNSISEIYSSGLMGMIGMVIHTYDDEYMCTTPRHRNNKEMDILNTFTLTFENLVALRGLLGDINTLYDTMTEIQSRVLSGPSGYIENIDTLETNGISGRKIFEYICRYSKEGGDVLHKADFGSPTGDSFDCNAHFAWLSEPDRNSPGRDLVPSCEPPTNDEPNPDSCGTVQGLTCTPSGCADSGTCGAQWPVGGTITQPFGVAWSANSNFRHPSVDIAGGLGTPVRAMMTGRVTFVQTLTAGERAAQDNARARYRAGTAGISAVCNLPKPSGNAVVICHDSTPTCQHEICTRYMHLNSIAVAVGDVVAGGQTIGTLGTTGCSTGPHLDFGIGQKALLTSSPLHWPRGSAIDYYINPEVFLAGGSVTECAAAYDTSVACSAYSHVHSNYTRNYRPDSQLACFLPDGRQDCADFPDIDGASTKLGDDSEALLTIEDPSCFPYKHSDSFRPYDFDNLREIFYRRNDVFGQEIPLNEAYKYAQFNEPLDTQLDVTLNFYCGADQPMPGMTAEESYGRLVGCVDRFIHYFRHGDTPSPDVYEDPGIGKGYLFKSRPQGLTIDHCQPLTIQAPNPHEYEEVERIRIPANNPNWDYPMNPPFEPGKTEAWSPWYLIGQTTTSPADNADNGPLYPRNMVAYTYMQDNNEFGREATYWGDGVNHIPVVDPRGKISPYHVENWLQGRHPGGLHAACASYDGVIGPTDILINRKGDKYSPDPYYAAEDVMGARAVQLQEFDACTYCLATCIICIPEYVVIPRWIWAVDRMVAENEAEEDRCDADPLCTSPDLHTQAEIEQTAYDETFNYVYGTRRRVCEWERGGGTLHRNTSNFRDHTGSCYVAADGNCYYAGLLASNQDWLDGHGIIGNYMGHEDRWIECKYCVTPMECCALAQNPVDMEDVEEIDLMGGNYTPYFDHMNVLKLRDKDIAWPEREPQILRDPPPPTGLGALNDGAPQDLYYRDMNNSPDEFVTPIINRAEAVHVLDVPPYANAGDVVETQWFPEFETRAPFYREWDSACPSDFAVTYGDMAQDYIPGQDAYDVTVVGIGMEDRNCGYGGWEELKLYQARCMQMGLNCLCRYESVFKPGSAEEYVLRAAGGMYKGYIQPSPNATTTDFVPENFVIGTKIMPLRWRGYVSEPDITLRFPYLGRYSQVQQYFTEFINEFGMGIDAAKPGDILIWDRDVVGPSKEGWAGMPGYVSDTYLSHQNNLWSSNTPIIRFPHVAIVVAACTAESPCQNNEPYYVKVMEMNYGKFPDICGNTDRWGHVTTRYLFKNASPSGRMPINTNNLVGSFEDCADPDYRWCHESLWNLVKVYRPTRDRVESPELTAITADDNPLTWSRYNVDDLLKIRTIEEFRQLNDYDPPFRWLAPPLDGQTAIEPKDRARIPLKPGTIFQRFPFADKSGMPRYAKTSIRRATDPANRTVHLFTQTPGSTPPTTPTPVELVPIRDHDPCTISSEYCGSGSTLPTPTPVPTMIPGGATPPPSNTPTSGPGSADGSHPSDQSSPAGCGGDDSAIYCQEVASQGDPTLMCAANHNPVGCFTTGNEACDILGSITTEHEGPLSSKVTIYDDIYRDYGYSRDYIASHLVHLGFFDPDLLEEVDPFDSSTYNAEYRKWQIIKKWLPKYWGVEMPGYSSTPPNVHPNQFILEHKIDHYDFVHNRLRDRFNPSDSSFSPESAREKIIEDSTIAVIYDDCKFYRGQAGVVANYLPDNACVYLKSRNWLQDECQVYNDENCYQAVMRRYSSFTRREHIPEFTTLSASLLGETIIPQYTSCIPLEQISLLWNPCKPSLGGSLDPCTPKEPLPIPPLPPGMPVPPGWPRSHITPPFTIPPG